MDYLPIFMAPITVPGRMTLQANRETWEKLLTRMPAQYRGLPPLIRTALDASTSPSIRITFEESVARRILLIAGVSA